MLRRVALLSLLVVFPLSFGPALAAPAPQAERPLRLFDPPEEVRVTYGLPDGPPVLFVWRRATHRVAAATGQLNGKDWSSCMGTIIAAMGVLALALALFRRSMGPVH